LTHSTNPVDALRQSRIKYVAMMGTPKMTLSASRFSEVATGISASASSLAILIVGVLLLIGSGG
jgi:hypothetical protein